MEVGVGVESGKEKAVVPGRRDKALHKSSLGLRLDLPSSNLSLKPQSSVLAINDTLSTSP